MSRKESSSFDPCRTSGQGYSALASHESLQKNSETSSPVSLTSLKFSEKCVDDSRLNDSGVWSGSNIQSEEIINTPESPVSKSGEFTFSSDKVSGDKSYMRLDSGIDVSVSQQFSELSLKDGDTYNDLNSKGSSPSKNINEQFTNVNNQKSSGKTPFVQKQTLLDSCFLQNEDGDTDLHLAIIHKFIETVYALVRMVPHPKYLNIKNNERQTPLHLAVLTRQPRLVRLLVCGGAALDILDRCGNTALHLAVQADNLACVRAIIDPITTPETFAAQLQYSPYPFYSHNDIANIYNYEGQTCVHLAALNGNIEILRYLLWYGANINAREWKGGHTCLHMAVERKDVALCMFLLGETQIDADEMSYAGYTAYQSACYDWDSTIADALRKHGADTYLESDTDSDDDVS